VEIPRHEIQHLLCDVCSNRILASCQSLAATIHFGWRRVQQFGGVFPGENKPLRSKVYSAFSIPNRREPKGIIRKNSDEETIETKDLGNALVHSKNRSTEEVLQLALENSGRSFMRSKGLAWINITVGVVAEADGSAFFVCHETDSLKKDLLAQVFRTDHLIINQLSSSVIHLPP